MAIELHSTSASCEEVDSTLGEAEQTGLTHSRLAAAHSRENGRISRTISNFQYSLAVWEDNRLCRLRECDIHCSASTTPLFVALDLIKGWTSAPIFLSNPRNLPIARLVVYHGLPSTLPRSNPALHARTQPHLERTPYVETSGVNFLETKTGGQRISIRFHVSRLVWWTFKRLCEAYLFLLCLIIYWQRYQGLDIRAGRHVEGHSSVVAAEMEYELGKIAMPVPRMMYM